VSIGFYITVSVASYITGTNPIELHSFEEILATATMKNLDTGEQKPLSEYVKELPKVRSFVW
jgi:hypothetical protein